MEEEDLLPIVLLMQTWHLILWCIAHLRRYDGRK